MEILTQKYEYDLKSTNNKSQQAISALEKEIENLALKSAAKDLLLKYFKLASFQIGDQST